MQEVLANFPPETHSASTPAVAAQAMAALARLEAEPLPKADFPAHRSLEALRLEDPATIFGCWNPGCAAAPAMAGCWKAHDIAMHLAYTCTQTGMPAGNLTAT